MSLKFEIPAHISKQLIQISSSGLFFGILFLGDWEIWKTNLTFWKKGTFSNLASIREKLRHEVRGSCLICLIWPNGWQKKDGRTMFSLCKWWIFAFVESLEHTEFCGKRLYFLSPKICRMWGPRPIQGGCTLAFPALFCQYLWQLTRLAWKHKYVNATCMLFILEGIKIA